MCERWDEDDDSHTTPHGLHARSGGLRVLGGVMWEGVVVRIGDDSVD